MLNIGTGEILVILLLALLVLGPDKLPEAARTMGRAVREIRRLSSGLQHEMREAMKAADIDIDLPGITSTAAGVGAAGATSPGLHPGLGPGPRLEAGAVVIDGTSQESPVVAGEQPDGPVVHTDGPAGSFS